jgi:hypothetical protein
MRAMAAKKSKWKGALAKPIRGPTSIIPQGYIVVPENMNAEDKPTPEAMDKAIARTRVEKLHLLFEHYGIEDKSDYCSLSLALAIEHVPGFAVKHIPYKLRHGDYGAVEPATKTGRRLVWTSERLGALTLPPKNVSQG